MKTRSQTCEITEKNTIIFTNKKKYPVFTKFDEASEEWNKNKRNIGCGQYEYICAKKMRNGRICQKNENHSGRCSSSL